jgi:hypothetical protein
MGRRMTERSRVEGPVRVLSRVPRHDAELGGLDLFARLDEGTRGRLTDPARVGPVIDRFRAGVTTSLANPARVHGWHLQLMFAEIVRGLGRCRFLKEDDQGTMWADPRDELRQADYRIVLLDGQNLLIEVKNHAPNDPRTPFTVRLRDLEGFKRYAELAGGRPLYAVFWVRWGSWTLVDPSWFEPSGTRARLSFESAMMGNEFALLGDVTLATVPPIELVIDVDQVGRRRQLKDRSGYRATIQAREITLFAGGHRLDRPDERRLAFYLALNGKWPEREQHEEVGGRLRRLRFVHEPEEWPREQGFAFLGPYSEILSRAYWLRTTEDGEITRLRAALDPSSEGLIVPEGYRSDALPLWRFVLQPQAPQLAEIAALDADPESGT